MKKYITSEANINDINMIANIEKEFFGDYSRAYDEKFIYKWYQHNPHMFKTVKDEENKVVAFFIVAPITQSTHKRLVAGDVSDMYDFQDDDVLKDFDTDYYYVADICISKKNEGLNYYKVATLLIKQLIKFLYKQAKYVTTSPITKEGTRLCEQLGFEKVSEEIFEGKAYSVCQLVVDEKKKKSFEKRFKM